MKKIIVWSTLILLLFSLCACKPATSSPDAAASPKEETTITLQVEDEQSALYMYNHYRVSGEHADNLLAYLETLDYSGERCDCITTHYLYVGDEEYASYGMTLNEYEFHITHDGGQTVGLTPEQRSTVEGLLSFIEHKDNYLPVEEEKYGITVTRREGEGYQNYSFFNSDSADFFKLIRSLDYTEVDSCEDADVKFVPSEFIAFRYTFHSGEHPHITKDGKEKATLTAEQATTLAGILERNCTAENKVDPTRKGRSVYITDLAANEQYLLQNGELETVLSILDSQVVRHENYDYIFPTYTSATHKIHYENGNFGLRRYYIYFENNLAHIHCSNNSHTILSIEDSALLQNALKEHSSNATRITDKDKLSDMEP